MIKSRLYVALIVVVFLSSIFFSNESNATPQVYTTDSASLDISRFHNAGATREVLLQNFGYAFFLAADESAQKVYWGSAARILRANFDGSGFEILFDAEDGLGGVSGITLDTGNGKIYFVDYDLGAILRANMDGSGSIETVFDASNSVFAVQDLAFDSVGAKLYWTTFNYVQRGNADGSGVIQTLFAPVGGVLGGVSLDVGAGKVYWTDQGTSDILRGNMDGSGSIETLFGPGDNVVGPYDLAIDSAAGKLIWVNGTGSVRSGNSNGAGASSLLYSNLSEPRGIALASQSATLYILANSSIISGPKNGGTVSTLLDMTGKDSVPNDLVLDLPANYMYIADGGLTTKIFRVRLDFEGVTGALLSAVPETLYDFVTDGIGVPYGLALDRVENRLYWAGGLGSIQRGSLDGSAPVEDLYEFADGLFSPVSLALDQPNGVMYWTDLSTKKVQRGKLDGTGAPTDLFSQVDGLMLPHGIDIDVAAGYVYWSDRGTKKIQRGEIGGGGSPEDLFEEADGLTAPTRLKLSLAEGKIYWAEEDKIFRGNIDGSGVPELLANQGLLRVSGFIVTADSDNDGIPDEIDLCPQDPAKSKPLLCGCGVADSDTNANGITDCELNKDIKDRVNTLKKLIKKLKSTNTGDAAADAKRIKAQRKAVKSIKSISSEINSNIKLNAAAIQLKSSKVNIKKLAAAAKAAAKKATDTASFSFALNKSAALSALSKLTKAML